MLLLANFNEIILQKIQNQSIAAKQENVYFPFIYKCVYIHNSTQNRVSVIEMDGQTFAVKNV